jgi:hypothetical protein
MKNILSTTLVAAIASLAVGNLAQANPIQGSIAFAGGGGLNTATTTVTLHSPGFVIATTGDFSAVTLVGGAFFTPSINYGSPVLPIAPLWDFATTTDGAFSFEATTLSWSSGVGGAIDLTGMGWFTDAGGPWSMAAGTWNLQIGSDGSISFAAQSSTNSVPDNNSTILLVGLGIVGLGLYASRKRLVKA